MKITKSQFKQLIKEEVSKQKNIMEMQEKKQAILKELNEMGYGVEEECMESECVGEEYLEETSIISPEEEAALAQAEGGETLEEGKIVDFFKSLSLEGLKKKFFGFVANKLEKAGLTEIPEELMKYSGKSFFDIKKDIMSQMNNMQLAETEGMNEGVASKMIQKIVGYAAGTGALGTVVSGIASAVMNQMGNFGLGQSLEGVAGKIAIGTAIALVIYLVSLYYNTPDKAKSKPVSRPTSRRR